MARLKRRLKSVPALFGLLKGVKTVLLGVGRAIVGLAGEIGFLASSYRTLRGFDLLLTTGSGQLLDLWGGALAYPYTHLKWALLCRLSGTRYGIMSVGAGPVSGRLSRRLTRWAVNLAQYRSFRDSSSRDLLVSIGCTGVHRVEPDLALSFPVEAEGNGTLRFDSTTPVVVTPVPYCDPRHWPIRDQQRYGAYLDKLAVFIRWLHGQGTPVILNCNKPRVDRYVLDDLEARVREGGSIPVGLLRRNQSESLADMAATLRSAGVVVATRFHGVLLACLYRRLPLGLAYGPKTVDMMTELGVGGFCLDVDDFTIEDLRRGYLEAIRRQEEIRATLTERCACQRELLIRQYERVLALMEEGQK
jgi:polysaccharide pyruvyl transferase WcaK-like protein